MDNIEIEEIDNRQKNIIPKEVYDKVALIIGVGGIGSWVAIDIALLGVKTIILIDPDDIEKTNLNRTLFKLEDIGRPKVDAIEDLINERRYDVQIFKHNEYFSEEHISDYKPDVIIDCTDNLNTRNFINQIKDKYNIQQYIKLGYDGFHATISYNHYGGGAFDVDESDGGESPYTIVPSFFGTPSILAAMGITQVLLDTNKEPFNKTFNIKNIVCSTVD